MFSRSAVPPPPPLTPPHYYIPCYCMAARFGEFLSAPPALPPFLPVSGLCFGLLSPHTECLLVCWLERWEELLLIYSVAVWNYSSGSNHAHRKWWSVSLCWVFLCRVFLVSPHTDTEAQRMIRLDTQILGGGVLSEGACYCSVTTITSYLDQRGRSCSRILMWDGVRAQQWVIHFIMIGHSLWHMEP